VRTSSIVVRRSSQSLSAVLAVKRTARRRSTTSCNYGKEGSAAKPQYISFKSVEYAATNTTNKLGGANFARGVVAALVDPSTSLERIETSLRV
jgi:hypothetical protein